MTIKKIKDLDLNNMAILCDGTNLILDGNSKCVEDINDDDLARFVNAVEVYKYDSMYKIEVVFIREFNYYLIGLIGISDEEWVLLNKNSFSELGDNLLEYLNTEHGIDFV